MKLLDFHAAWAAMSPVDQSNFNWAMNQVRHSVTNKFVFSAWALYLFCTTQVKTKTNFSKSIRKGQALNPKFLQDLGQQVASPSCDNVVIGTGGGCAAIFFPDGRIETLGGDLEETTAYEITREDLFNIKGVRNDN